MNDQEKSREQLIAELARLRQRVAALERIDSDRNRSEEELRRSEAKWRSVVDNAPVFVAVIDHADKIEFLNHAAPGMTVQDALGKSIYDFIQPEYADTARQAIERVRLRNEAAFYETTSTGPHGRLSWYKTHVGPVQFDHECVAVALISQDITERKQAEARLEAQTALLEGIMESTDSPIFSVDRDYCYTSFNRSHAATMKSIYGAEIELGNNILEYHTRTEDRSKVKAYLDRTLAGERFVIEEDAGENALSRPCFEISHNPIQSINREVVGAAVYAKDITEWKRTEDALRESGKRFRSLFQDSSVGSVVVTPNGHFIQVNRAFCEFLGYSEQEVVGKSVNSLTYPDDRETSSKNIYQAAHFGPRIQRFEKRFLHKSGRVLWGEVSSNLICDADGRPNYFITQVLDITERKRTQEALRQSEQRLSLHFQQTPLVAIEWDLEHRVSRWNPGAERVFGYTEDEVLGRHFAFLVPTEALEHVNHVWAALLRKKGGERSTNENVTKDGRTVLCEWYNTPLVDPEGKVVGFASLAQDITEQTRMESALRESERRLSTLISNLPGVAYRCKADPDWTIEFLSEGYSSLTGYPVANMPGEGAGRDLDLIHSSDRQVAWEQIQEALAQKRQYQLEYRLRSATGQEKWAWEQGTGVFSESGELKAIEGFATDITERKQAQLALQQAHDELEQRVEEQTAELRHSYEELRQTQATLDAFFSASTAILNILDDEFRYLKTDGLTPTYFGLDSRSIVGRSMGDLAPQWVEKYGAMVRRVVESGEPVHNVEISSPVPSRPGEIAYWRASYFAISLPHGKRGSGVVAVEITDLKQAEAKLKAEQRALQRMVLASDHERRLITYELHDGVAQQLLGAIMHFQAIKPSRKSKAAEVYHEGMEALRRASLENRRLMNRLRTPALEEFGLIAAIDDVASQLRSATEAPEIEYRHAVKFKRLEPTLENTVFRIAQEAMTNACRHSKSEKVRVKLTQKGGDVILEVRDWGIGFDQGTVGESRFGLEGIRERSRILGGKVTIKSQPGQGTVVQVKFPVTEATDAE